MALDSMATGPNLDVVVLSEAKLVNVISVIYFDHWVLPVLIGNLQRSH